MRLRDILKSADQIPQEWRQDFDIEWLATSYKRCILLAKFTLLFSFFIAIILILSHFIADNPTLETIITIFLGLTAIISFVVIDSPRYINESHRKQQLQAAIFGIYSFWLVVLFNSLFLLIWVKTGLNTAYTNGILIYAILLYKPNRNGTIFYCLNYIFYLACLSLFPSSRQVISLISGTAATLFGWVISHILFSFHIQQYVNQRTIKMQAEQLRQANQELTRLTSVDGLTLIANRRRFDQYLAEQWQRLKDSHDYLSILLCDVDYFKLYNDTYGHQAGDECLQEIAAIISTEVRRSQDLVARYGGEEFVIIMPKTGQCEAIQAAERICQTVQSHHIAHNASIFGEVTISIGVFCQIPSQINTAQQLIAEADKALYLAKCQGRNRVVLVSDSGTTP